VKKEICVDCNGDGVCPYCNGAGTNDGAFSCDYCESTGRCRLCNGRGERSVMPVSDALKLLPALLACEVMGSAWAERCEREHPTFRD
jgi:RecJ-like exonuclease